MYNDDCIDRDEDDGLPRGDEPGAMPSWPEPFTDAWRTRFALAECELQGLEADIRQLEKDRRDWPRLIDEFCS